MTTSSLKKLLAGPISIALVCLSWGVSTSVYGATATGERVLEEILVTARKRQESLQDAPLSVTAVSGENMDDVGITSMEQISAQVPGLQIGRGLSTSQIYIRGVGSGLNQGFEQSAGMYIDGVYLPRSRQFTQSLVDLDRVEVLRGPQGILFGKNTIAGAIKVESATTLPGEEFSGSVSLDSEPEFGTVRGTVVLSGSPTENLGARLALRYQESDGYLDHKLFNEDQPASDDTMARLSLAWAATENLQIVGKFSYADSELDGYDQVNHVVDPSILNTYGPPAAIGTFLALTTVPGFATSTQGDEWDSWLANTTYGLLSMDTESTQASVKFDWDVGDYTITGVTGFTDFEWQRFGDADNGPLNLVGINFAEDLESVSQEFRIASNYDGSVNFVAGVYYEEQEFFATNNPTVLDSAALGLPVPHISRTPVFDQETETIAVFAEANYDLTDALVLDVGFRYSEDTKDVIKQVTLGAGLPGATVTYVNPDGTPTAAGVADPGTAGFLAAVWGASFSTFPHDQDLSRDEDHFDPMIRIRWTPSEDTMLYLSYTEGYKSGGVNFSPDSANPDGSPGEGTEFEDEEAEAWEAGIRATVLDGRARLGATVFQTEIDNLQVTSFTGVTFTVGNAAKMTTQGLELEGQFLVADQLEFGGSLMYLDSEFDEFPGGPCTAAQIAAGCPNGQDLSGETAPYAPEWSGTLYAQFDHQLADDWMFLGRVEVSYKDEFFTDADRDPAALVDSYTKINARLAFTTMNGNLELALYGRNLTDEATYTATVDSALSPGIYSAIIEEPRTYGLQVRYNF